MSYKTAGATPEWAEVYGFTEDGFIDIWQEATDPVNERGELAVAYFTEDFHPYSCTLVGASIEDTSGTIYRDREWLIKMIGIEEINRYELSVENHRIEKLAEGDCDDTLYDEWKEDHQWSPA